MLPKRLFDAKNCDRLTNLQGFHVIEDLVQIYRMVYNLDKYTTLSKSARNRLKWMDYYRQCYSTRRRQDRST